MKTKIINILFVCAIFYVGFESGILKSQIEHKKQQVAQMQAMSALNAQKKTATEAMAEELEDAFEQLEKLEKTKKEVQDESKIHQNSTQKNRRSNDSYSISYSDYSLFIEQNREYDKLLSSESTERMQ